MEGTAAAAGQLNTIRELRMTIKLAICTSALALTVAGGSPAGPPGGGAFPAPPENFLRPEPKIFLGTPTKLPGRGNLKTRREPMAIDDQSVVRGNRDTLYTSGVFDLDAGPV